MRKLIFILVLSCLINTPINAQARRVVIEMNHANYNQQLLKAEIDVLEIKLTQLLREYIEYSNFQNEEGTYSSENNKAFINLFSENARIYSDLHLSYREVYPEEYVEVVKTNFGDYGLDATIDFAGLISLQPSNLKNEFIAHLSIDKVNYSKVAINGERIFFRDGQHAKFNMYVLANLTENKFKIIDISNDEAKPIQQVNSSSTIAAIDINKSPSYVKVISHESKTKNQYKPSSFLRFSLKSSLQPYLSTLNSPSVTKSIGASIMMYKFINNKATTYLTFGVSAHKLNMSADITKDGIALLHNEPIAYISSSKGELLISKEEPNLIKTTINDGSITEQLDYQYDIIRIGLSHKIYSSKLNIYLGAELLPGRIIFKNGRRASKDLSLYKVPNNSYFPNNDIINTIEPGVLNNPNYLIAEDTNTPLYDSDRFEVSGSANMMIEYKIGRRFSISSKLSQRIPIWNQKNTLLDSQFNQTSNSPQEPLKINSLLIDLGILLKY